MRFWDSSALVALFVAQRASESVRAAYAEDPEVVAWTLSDVEVRSALARLERDGAMTSADARACVETFEAFWRSLHVVSVVDAVKSKAKRLLGVHALRAGDSLQLAAALTAAGDDPLGFELVCLDERLGEAARREGFALLP